MSEWVTIKIKKSVHGKAVEITQKTGRYLGLYLTEAIEERNEVEQQVLTRMQEQQIRQDTRRRYGV